MQHYYICNNGLQLLHYLTIPGSCPDSGCDPVLTSTGERYNLVSGSSDNLIPKLQVHSRVGAVSTSVPVIFSIFSSIDRLWNRTWLVNTKHTSQDQSLFTILMRGVWTKFPYFGPASLTDTDRYRIRFWKPKAIVRNVHCIRCFI